MPIEQIDLSNHARNPIAYDSAPDQSRGTFWLDICEPNDADLDWLNRSFQFHPLTLEDVKNFNQRAKVEAYDGYLFLSVTTMTRSDRELTAHEVEVYLGRGYLITIHRDPSPSVEWAREHVTPKMGPDYILYLIVDHMADVYFPLLDEMEDEIDELEDEILENATQVTLHRIFRLKQQLVFLRKTSAPMRDVMNALAGTRYGLVDEHTALYYRDVYDHLARIYDLVETSRDLLGNALDAYLSTVSNRLNEVMKRLTLIATIFMPISFLVGLGGINFQQMPFDNPLAFVIFMAAVILVPATMLMWFWRSKFI